MPTPLNDALFETRYQAVLEEAGIAPTATTADYGWHLHADGRWLVVRNPAGDGPDQGWKLHVSASLHCAEEVLRRALPVLMQECATFKVARSPHHLISLNLGEGGLSQVGKFITVYPRSDAQSVRLAVALDRATHGLSGPLVASDRPLTPQSLVHYRYGGYSGTLYFQTPVGQLRAAIRTPTGDIMADRRPLMYQPPAWAEDPFEQAGVVTPLPKAKRLFQGRYLPMAALHRSARSTVYLALDSDGGKGCVLKEVRQVAPMNVLEIPASTGVRREAEVLQQLAPDRRFPTYFDSFEENGRWYLVLEDMGGQTLESVLGEYRNTCRRLDSALIVQWTLELVAILEAIHAKGYVYRDLKSANVIVAPEGQLRLLDFDLTTPLGTLPLSPGSGTRGYMSPQQAANGVAEVTDDVYSLGALLYMLATGAESSRAPDPLHLFSRHPLLLNPALDAGLVPVMERCLALDPGQRYATMGALATALHALAVPEQDAPPRLGHSRVQVPDGLYFRERAERLGATLLTRALPRLEGEGLLWLSEHGTAAGMYSRDINSGTGGALLAVLELAHATGEPRYAEAARKGASWLRAAPIPEGAIVPGLYVGEAGRVFLYWRTGEQLNDDGWREEAVRRSHLLATLPYASPDIFNGTAGRLRTHLRLWAGTHTPEQLDYARRAGQTLLEAATVEPNGDTYWRIPEGFESLSGHCYFGYAHGAAGIADALLDLYAVVPDPHLHQAIVGAAAWLQRHALPTPFDHQGVAWGQEVGQPVVPSFWCHGGTGIGHFLLRAGVAGLVAEGTEWAERAVRGVVWGTRWTTPPQCHGLAGNIDFLLNVFAVTGASHYYREALALGALLDAFGVEEGGHLVWSSESPMVFSPDYMVGYAGVVSTLLRLADPGLPHPLHPLHAAAQPLRSSVISNI